MDIFNLGFDEVVNRTGYSIQLQ